MIDDDLAIDCEAPSRVFGPRPPVGAPLATGDDRSARSRRWRVAALSSALAAVGMAIAVVVAGQGARPAAAAGRHPAACGGAISRNGCATSVRWRAPMLSVGSDRYRLGRAGDVLLLGDWQCAGRDAPALYRPATGEIFVFGGWADDGQPARATTRLVTGRRRGTPAVVRDETGCDRPVVKTAERT